MCTDTIIEDARWSDANLPQLAERAAAATLAHLNIPREDIEIAILACDDTRIAALNADFRGKPTATNVLSWPTEDLAPEHPGTVPHPHGDPELGNIAISYDTCAREAATSGISFNEHVTHLVVHGVLHLLGYDHIRDPDATLMEETERQILGKLGVNDPYSHDPAPTAHT